MSSSHTIQPAADVAWQTTDTAVSSPVVSVPGRSPDPERRQAPWFAMWRQPWVATVVIVVLAAALRLPNLGTNPGWDGDEGYNYNIALNLAHGHRQMFALAFVFVQHPPLFFLLAAGLFHLLGAGMFALRLLSILCSLGTLLLLRPLAYELVDYDRCRPGPEGPWQAADLKRSGWSSILTRPFMVRPLPCAFKRGQVGQTLANQAAEPIALLSMLAYAVTPLVALQNRFGYTYNGLALWTVLALLAVLRYRRTGSQGALVVSGVATALALTTDQEGLYLLPVLLFGLAGASLVRRLLACALALAGAALYIGAMALADPSALVFDVTHTASRVAGGSLPRQAVALLYYLADLLRFDPVIPLGLAGLALIPCRPARRLLLGLLAMMLLVILKVRDPNPLFRTAEPLLPLVCLGLGTCGAVLWGRAGAMRRGRGMATAALLVMVVTGAAVTYDARSALTRFPTRIGGLLPRSTTDAAVMAGWLNRRLRPTDLVIAMPQVSWTLHARTTELLQAVAYRGQASAFYPAGIARRRWRYDAGIDAARFLVVDDFTRSWIAENAPERTLVTQARRAWRPVYTHGEYTIYENPAHAN